MGGLVAQGSHFMNELVDQLSGNRSSKKHTHHKAGDLTESVISGISKIVELRREIESKKK